MAAKRAVFTPPAKDGLPRQEEAERAVLGGLLIDNSLIAEVRGQLAWKDFFFERHQLIYQSCLRLIDRGMGVDIVTVRSDLEDCGQVDLAGGIAYIANLDLDLPDLGRIADYARIVAEHSVRRGLIDVSSRAIQLALDPGTVSVVDIIGRVEKEVTLLSTGAAPGDLSPVGATIHQIVADVEDRHERGGQDLFGLSTGLRDFDRKSKGLIGGELIVIAGRPGQGKSALAVGVAKHAALHLGRPAAVFSLEMGIDELTLRLISSEAGVPFTQLQTGVLSRDQWARVHKVERVLYEAPLYLSSNPRISTAGLCAAIRRQHAETPLALAVLDYLQLMVEGFEKRRELIEHATRTLKLLAMDLKIPLIAVSQLSRAPDGRADGRPKLSDLREAGGIEQDADMVAFSVRPGDYLPDDRELDGVADLIIAKRRNGATGDVRVAWDGPTMTFSDLQRGEPPF